jgi:hypothetical protein
MIKAGHTVVFKNSIVRMCGNSAEVANRKGVVISVQGAIAKVEFGKTWINEDGRTLRSVPVNNLVQDKYKAID